jgi:DNA uptake protein ComE-like DNA-binding protein
MVRDVTPALLFGPDLNRNCAIDASEQALTAIENADNSTGLLNRGWSAYLTLDSAERNLRSDGRPKIDVNMDDLKELHKQLSEVFSKEQADFIVAYRQGGAYDGDDAGQPISGVTVDLSQQGRVRLNTVLDLIGVKTRIPRPGQGAPSGSGGASGDGGPGGEGSSGGGSSRGGGSTRESYGTVRQSDGESSGRGRGGDNDSSTIVIDAAFSEERSAMQSYLPLLMDNLAVNAQPSIPGRLNINQAPRQLLNGVPGLSATAVEQIIANRDVTLGLQGPEQLHETWILMDGIVELDDMKKLMALVTSGGSVYRAQVVGGFFAPGGPVDRLEFVVDATKTPPVVRRRWELRDLGPGYSMEVLGAEADDTP